MSLLGQARQAAGGLSSKLPQLPDLHRLIIEPVTAALKLGRTSKVFPGKTELEIVLLLLQEEIQDNSVFTAALNLDNPCRGTFPVREFIFLCGENKSDFIRRRLAKIGVSFVFAPAQEGTRDYPQHPLILFTDSPDLDVNAATLHSAPPLKRSSLIRASSGTSWPACLPTIALRLLRSATTC